jgi:rRNA-processing protein CGR1
VLWLTSAPTGKNWHEQKKAFRPTAGQTSYEKRAALRNAMAEVKAKEREMKEEKQAERQVSHIGESPS